MGTLGRCQQSHLTAGQVHSVGGAACGLVFVGIDKEVLALGVEAYNAFHFIVALGHLAQQLTVGIVEIEVLVAVAHTVPQELVSVVGQKHHGVAGFHIARVGLLKEHRVKLAVGHIIAFQPHVVLPAINLGDIKILLVGVPADVGEVILAFLHGFVAAGVEIQHRTLGSVIDAHCHLMALHAGHGVFERLLTGNAGGGVHQGVVGHHRLVHAVKGQEVALRRPEGTLFNTELIAMHRLAIDNVLIGRLNRESIDPVLNVQVVVAGIGRSVVVLLYIQMICILYRISGHHREGTLGHIITQHLAFGLELHFLIADNLAVGEIAQRLLTGCGKHLVQRSEREACLGLAHIEHRVLHIGYLVAVPHKLHVSHRGLGVQATCHQLLGAEHLVLCNCTDRNKQCNNNDYSLHSCKRLSVTKGGFYYFVDRNPYGLFWELKVES